MVVIGGAGSFIGPSSARRRRLLPEWLRFAEGYYLIMYAVLVMLMMAFCPTGIVGLARAPLRLQDGWRGGRQVPLLEEAKT